jgi:allantoate deiminase
VAQESGGGCHRRCRGGISHHPDEHVEAADADAGARVLLRLIENFRPREAS